MTFFAETVRAQLSGATVVACYLVEVAFTSRTMRLWTGAGRITAGGHAWDGLGRFGGISGLDAAINGKAPQTTFTLSGVDPEIMQSAMRDYHAEADGNTVRVYMQFFDAATIVQLDDPYQIWSGVIRTADFAADASGMAEVSIGAESLFVLRDRPVFGHYTDSDQRSRSPGDRLFEYVPAMQGKVVTWPVF